jgi:cold shock CspA family protein
MPRSLQFLKPSNQGQQTDGTRQRFYIRHFGACSPGPDQGTTDMKPDDAPKLVGTIKWWNSNKGVGFIAIDELHDIFAHISQVPGDSDYPKKGDKVTFVADAGRDGRSYARNIVVVRNNLAEGFV